MSNMNGGVMRSQWARVGAGYMPPARPFAQLPNPDSVIGQVYIASDVGPAPGIELIAAPGRWRPRGGRQVLAMRSINPVTVQNLAGAVADTIGPFPGGLVRAGMRLEMDVTFTHSGIGSGPRSANLRINDATFAWMNSVSSGAFLIGRTNGSLGILGDGNTAHLGTMGSGGGAFLAGVGNQLAPVLDFSQPWSSQIYLVSAAETATTITSATWAAGVATFVNPSHTLNTGDKTTVAGVTPSGFNGIYTGVTRIDADTWSGTRASDPGGAGTGGTSSRISNVTSRSYVLELVG